MSESERLVNACTKCDSSQVETHGTNVRGAGEARYYQCRACGHRMEKPKRRPLQREMPDKPPNGFARKVWEMAEQERGD